MVPVRRMLNPRVENIEVSGEVSKYLVREHSACISRVELGRVSYSNKMIRSKLDTGSRFP